MENLKCPICHKAPKALHYCRRPECGLRPSTILMSASTGTQSHYNELLQQVQIHLSNIKALSNEAYKLAQAEETVNRLFLLKIAEVSSDFAVTIERAKPL